jgi:transcriptional antiterminator RfaH
METQNNIASQLKWFVLYTKSRNEKIVAERLTQIGIEVFCPVVKTTKQWSDRKKTIEEPLFKSYVFVRLEEKHRAKVFEVQGVVRYLFWLKQAAVVKDQEIQAIKDLLDQYDHKSISVTQLETSDRVKIKSGSLAETDGEIVGKQGKKIYVHIESLQMTVTVDLTRTEVNKIS